MRPVQMEEILPVAEYESVRELRRPAILAAREARRVALGPDMSVLFENRDTVWYQIQEMLRIERMQRYEDIRHEVDTYNELVPGRGELSATLLIEYPDPGVRARRLAALRGLDRDSLFLHVGTHPPIEAAFDERQTGDDGISAVHYLKWRVPGAAREAFRHEGLSGNIRLACRHPSYQAQAVLLPHVVESLWKDMTAAD